MSDESTIRYERGDDGIVVLTLDDPNQSANTMNAAFMASMPLAIERLEAEKDQITGVVITSAKKTFFAGADLRDLRRARPEDVEDLQLAGGGAVWERVAAIVDELGALEVGDSGLSDVGAVIGATAPGHLARARELMANATFLLPGVGAQGGRVEDLAPAFAPGRAGGLIAASRSIAEAHLANGGQPAAAACAEAERLREAAWALAT